MVGFPISDRLRIVGFFCFCFFPEEIVLNLFLEEYSPPRKLRVHWIGKDFMKTNLISIQKRLGGVVGGTGGGILHLIFTKTSII